MKKTAVLTLLSLFTALLLVLCARWGITAYNNRQVNGKLTSSLPPQTSAVGSFALTWDGESLFVTHASQPDKLLWQTLPGVNFVGAAQGEQHIEESRGSFFIKDTTQRYCVDQTVQTIEETAVAVTLHGQLTCGPNETVGYRLSFTESQPNHLQFNLALDDPAFDRTTLTYASSADERFFGFGTQFSFFDLKGRRVPIFISEQGIGRGAQPVTALVNLAARAGGNWATTYAAVPHYITSQMRSLFLENSERAIFDLRRDDRVQIQLMGSEMQGRILNGRSPAALIDAYTDYAGKMRPLPDWVHEGAIIGMQGGTERVREVWAQLDAAGVPITAFWLQDWVGQRATSFGKQLWWNWELDRDHYPDWAQLVDDMAEAGIRVLIYNNSFLANVSDKPNVNRHLFQEAAELGYLVQTASGEPYLIQNTDFNAGLVDLTNPDAREWLKAVIRDEMAAVGASGWMADFGEAFPTDGVTAGTVDPLAYHNQYAEDWAALNREVLDELPNSDEMLFFSRSGFTRSPRYSALFWLGDQLVTWDEHDGMKTAVTGLLSSGISGYAFNHSDIGGYTALTSPVLSYFRDKELLLRWMELNAFTAVYRTHEGNRPDDNHQIYSDDETLAHFARNAKIYQALAFYRQQLVAEAAETGLPVVRHPFIHYPDDPAVLDLTTQQFMLGDQFMIAPVLDPETDEVTVYLPAGEWVHLWTGETYSGGQSVTVAAPLGEPGVFYVAGSPIAAEFMQNLRGMGILES